jgi:hypothetical protein
MGSRVRIPTGSPKSLEHVRHAICNDGWRRNDDRLLVSVGTVAGEHPDISVVMPVRNGERYLDAALESLSGQTYPNFEIIVVDNGSSDRSAKILETWRAREPRLRVFYWPRPGLGSTLRFGVEQSTAPFIARLDADDLSAPDRLAQQMNRMLQDPGLGLLGSFVNLIDQRGAPLGTRAVLTDDKDLRAFLLRECPFVHSSILMRRSTYDQAGGYRAGLNVCEDFDLWARMAHVTRLANMTEPLVSYRVHPNSVTARFPVRFALVNLCIAAARVARQRGEPEPFIRGHPRVQTALRLLGVSTTSARYMVLKAVCAAARRARRDGDHQAAKVLRGRAFQILLRLPARVVWGHGIWALIKTYSK